MCRSCIMATLQTNEIESESQSTVGGKPAKYFPTIQFQVIIVFSCNSLLYMILSLFCLLVLTFMMLTKPIIMTSYNS